MATELEVRKLVSPLLTKRADLAFAKRLLFLKPLHHVLSAITLGRASDPNRVAVGTTINPIYHPGRRHLDLGWGVSRPDGYSYSLRQADAQELICWELELNVLPQLAAINDIPSFVAHATSNEFRKHHFEFGAHMTTAAALGNLDQAREYGDKLKSKGALNGPGYDAEATQSINNKRCLYDLVCAGDRTGIIALLHRWEAETAARWGLAKYWEPSPFPIEK